MAQPNVSVLSSHQYLNVVFIYLTLYLYSHITDLIIYTYKPFYLVYYRASFKTSVEITENTNRETSQQFNNARSFNYNCLQ